MFGTGFFTFHMLPLASVEFFTALSTGLQ